MRPLKQRGGEQYAVNRLHDPLPGPDDWKRRDECGQDKRELDAARRKDPSRPVLHGFGDVKLAEMVAQLQEKRNSQCSRLVLRVLPLHVSCLVECT